MTAIDYGDINIINKVIEDILVKRGKNDGWLQKFLTEYPIAKEKFVNYAKRKSDFALLDRLYGMFSDITSYANVLHGISRYKLANNPRTKEDELSKVE